MDLPAQLADGWPLASARRALENGTAVLACVRPDNVAPQIRLLGTLVLGGIEHATLDADRVTLEARDILILKTKRAVVTLRSNGEVEMLGTRIVSRARSLLKLLAPMLRLN